MSECSKARHAALEVESQIAAAQTACDGLLQYIEWLPEDEREPWFENTVTSVRGELGRLTRRIQTVYEALL